jgi:hypothetical protein
MTNKVVMVERSPQKALALLAKSPPLAKRLQHRPALTGTL